MSEKKDNRVQQLREQINGYDTEAIVKLFLSLFEGRIALSSSMAAEDQVLTDIICRLSEDPQIFTLDTGRLPRETYETIEATRNRYEINIQVMFPDSKQVESMQNESGPNLFYSSIENRKRCCYVRKIEPLKRALSGLDVWICGLRKEQSVTRQELEIVEWDEQFGLIKLSPLLNWTTQQVWDYIRKNNVPYNSLHDKGYPSIGCEPCTRAVREGEDIRSGRWWWEKPEQKECGLHLHEDNGKQR